MADLLYLDFDLFVQPIPGGYQARINSPAGQIELDVAVTQLASVAEMQRLLTHQGGSPAAAEPVDPSASPIARGDAKALGEQLFDTLFHGEALAAWRSSIAQAEQQNRGLRLRLRLGDAPELALLPWELLYDRIWDQFTALSGETPVVRYLEIPRTAPPLAVPPPLQLLVMIANPAGFASLDVDYEWQKIQRSLAPLVTQKRLVLSRLEPPTLSALQRALRHQDCHILHFVGHGGVDPANGEGLLVLEDSAGQPSLQNADRLGTLLQDHDPLRLVLLNSCEGSRGRPDDTFAGTAQTLVRKGIPAVIAMQFEISDTAATAFAEEFYLALTDYYPVDAALAEARKAIYLANDDHEWATPVLYMRAPDGRLFARQPEASPPHPTEPVPAPGTSPEATPEATHGTDAISVTIQESQITGSSIQIGGQSGPPAPQIGSPAGASVPSGAQLTGLEGQIRRLYRVLIDLEDRLLLTDNPQEKAELERGIAEQGQRVRGLLIEYAPQARQSFWQIPPDIQAAITQLGLSE